MSKLRSALEPDRDGQGTVVASTPVGYRLDPTAVVDAHEFDRLVHEASQRLANDPKASALKAEQALELWRGEPFGDLSETHYVASERHHLAGCRVVARRTVAQAHLALGDHTLAAELLESLVVDNPLDEGLVELLMLALHRGGVALQMAFEHFPNCVYDFPRSSVSSRLGQLKRPSSRC